MVIHNFLLGLCNDMSVWNHIQGIVTHLAFMTTYDLEQFVNVSRSYSSVRSIVLKLYDIMHMGKYNVEATDSLYYCR